MNELTRIGLNVDLGSGEYERLTKYLLARKKEDMLDASYVSGGALACFNINVLQVKNLEKIVSEIRILLPDVSVGVS